MNLLFITSLFWYTFNIQVNISIVDKQTNEPLVGVKESNSKTYSDLDGNLRILKGSDLNLSLISYENLNLNNIKNDTIIYLDQIN